MPMKTGLLCSMDKLFDLMLMGAKMQFVVSQAVDGMLAVTLRHLQVLRETLKKSPVPLSPDPIPLIDNFRALVHATYGSLPPGAWISLHRQLGNFFATRRVKVAFHCILLQTLAPRPCMHSCIHQIPRA